MSEHFDVLIIGAGLSGIGMACHLTRACAGKSVGILERRQAIGGTWDLFRYPGIRSDSDMMSFGYRFRPWIENRVLADGDSILRYVNDTARAYGVDKKVRFGLKITSADWLSDKGFWIVSAIDEESGAQQEFTCHFLISATGYYNYDQGYLPAFPGVDEFKGICIHPQHWPEGFDYKGKRVVVIGSGATAVTLVPSMAEDAAHVTMLQRSPSYVYSLPAVDRIAGVLKQLLPESWVYRLSRERNIRLTRLVYKASRFFPHQMRALLLAHVRRQLGNGVDMAHFTPRYMPWDERLCAVPDGDLFRVLREGKASVVTDHIERFTSNGILLKSGQELPADIVITATGLQLQMLGGMQLAVDGKIQYFGERLSYKSVLVEDIPNFGYLFGYTNISWTLKVDLAADYLCRLLNEMDRRGATAVTPRAPANERTDESLLGSLKAGYVQRDEDKLPRQGRSSHWRVSHHLERDRQIFRQPIDDVALQWVSG